MSLSEQDPHLIFIIRWSDLAYYASTGTHGRWTGRLSRTMFFSKYDDAIKLRNKLKAANPRNEFAIVDLVLPLADVLGLTEHEDRTAECEDPSPPPAHGPHVEDTELGNGG